jgi:hypothetical protein
VKPSTFSRATPPLPGVGPVPSRAASALTILPVVHYVTAADMLAELREDNTQLAARMRSAHGLCDEHGDIATASLLENWVDGPKGESGSSTRPAGVEPAGLLRRDERPIRPAPRDHCERAAREGVARACDRGALRGRRGAPRRGSRTKLSSEPTTFVDAIHTIAEPAAYPAVPAITCRYG